MYAYQLTGPDSGRDVELLIRVHRVVRDRTLCGSQADPDAGKQPDQHIRIHREPPKVP